jgi:beta-lactam-binding protein with PASTA domain
VSRSAVALVGASCFLAGVLLVVAIGAGTGETRTVTRARTVTVPATTTHGGTVVVTTAVPAVVGERLDVARERLERAGFDPDVEGGGVFGIVVESNWEVVAQDPGPGVRLERGSSVHIRVEKR